MSRFVVVFAVLVAAMPVPALGDSPAVEVAPVAFEVSNPTDPSQTWTVRGDLVLPDGGCTAGVMLLQHGLSYGRWGWDFPMDPDTYSVARALARRGYASVTIDRLGYGASGGDTDPDGRRANGYTLSVQSYAAMSAQIVDQLRDGSYGGPAFGRVGLVGHSAGTEISELTAGLFRNVDVLVATAYHHFPSQRIVSDFITGDVVRAAMDDYEYFGESPSRRAEAMYDLEHADPAVVAKDTELANLTPSGEVWSISNQPSRWVMGTIDVPVLLVVAENDVLFPPDSDSPTGGDNTANELALFAASPDASAIEVPDAGHTFMLHPNAPETNARIADWLDGRMPACA